jgi:hypothetical protein
MDCLLISSAEREKFSKLRQPARNTRQKQANPVKAHYISRAFF